MGDDEPTPVSWPPPREPDVPPPDDAALPPQGPVLGAGPVSVGAVALVLVLLVGVGIGMRLDDGSSPAERVGADGAPGTSLATPPTDASTAIAPDQPRPSTSASATEPTAGSVTTPPNPAVTHRVLRLDDGDSFDVADIATGALRTVRMAQVDAPELSECFGQDAKAWLSERILGRDVLLEPTTNGPDEDQYGRKVREVWLDGLSMNVEIVRAGFATHFASFASEDPELAVRIEAAEDEAREAGRGLWSACFAPAGGTAGGHTGRTDGGWACHPAYRECLPAHLSDLDCAEIGHQVELLGDEDPWRLDGNNTHRTDGRGCERFEPWSAALTYPYY